jgi:hypothetical protein
MINKEDKEEVVKRKMNVMMVIKMKYILEKNATVGDNGDENMLTGNTRKVADNTEILL